MIREEAKENISRWLSQENQWKVQRSGNDPNYYFFWNLDLDKIPVTICIENDIDRVDIISNVKFDQSDITSYKLTPDKHLFWSSLKMHTFPIGVIVNPSPNTEELESIQFLKLIYIDALTQDNFINTIIRVSDAVEISGFVLRRFLESLERKKRDRRWD